MKLLVVASMSQISTANYFVTALRRLGHELLVCSDIPGPQVDVLAVGLVDVNALMHKRAFAAQGVIFFEGGSMRLLPDVRRVKSCPTAWYAIDTHMDFDKHLRIGRLFDITFVAQKQYVEALSIHGVTQVQWLPLAFTPELLPSDFPPREVDIAYVGSDDASIHSQRSALLAALRSEFHSTLFGRATPEEMGHIYASAKLVFNRSINNDVNMRFFEAMGAGAVLLTDRIVDNGVEDLFEEGRHYLTYRDEQELLQLAHKLLSDPARIRAMGDSARALVLSKHTYQHRAELLVEQIQEAARIAKPAASDLFAACLALGLTADALRAAAEAASQAGGGRFQRSLGAAAALGIRLAARLVGSAERLRSTFRDRRVA